MRNVGAARSKGEPDDIERTIQPDRARSEEYGFWVARYIEMYASVECVMPMTALQVDETGGVVTKTEVPG